jgi:hypothetical protein
LAGGRARLPFCHVATPQQTVCQWIFGMIFYFENLSDFLLTLVDIRRRYSIIETYERQSRKGKKMDTDFNLTINGITYTAMWFDKEDDRVAEWYIFVNGSKIGSYAGYPGDAKHVENFIRNFLAK